MEITKPTPYSLTGKILVANPYCPLTDLFYRSLIYVIAHNSNGALGLIVNKTVRKIEIQSLFDLGKDADNTLQQLPTQVFIGGPVEIDKGFVIHSNEYQKNVLFDTSQVLISSNAQVIQDIIAGHGPTQHMIILGCTGWGPGQMEQEIERNYWLIMDCDADIIFDKENANKWDRSLKKLGVMTDCFISQQGNG